MLGLYVPTEWIFLFHLFLNMIDLCVTFELMNRMFGRIPGKHRKVYFTAGLVLILLLLCLGLPPVFPVCIGRDSSESSASFLLQGKLAKKAVLLPGTFKSGLLLYYESQCSDKPYAP